MANLVVLRREMVAVGREMKKRGFVVAAEGNLSVRISDHCFLITPAGVSKGITHNSRISRITHNRLRGYFRRWRS